MVIITSITTHVWVHNIVDYKSRVTVPRLLSKLNHTGYLLLPATGPKLVGEDIKIGMIISYWFLREATKSFREILFVLILHGCVFWLSVLLQFNFRNCIKSPTSIQIFWARPCNPFNKNNIIIKFNFQTLKVIMQRGTIASFLKNIFDFKWTISKYLMHFQIYFRHRREKSLSHSSTEVVTKSGVKRTQCLVFFQKYLKNSFFFKFFNLNTVLPRLLSLVRCSPPPKKHCFLVSLL